MLFFAFLQNPAGVSNLEVRTAGAALPLAETVRKVVREVEPNLDAFDVTTLSKRIDQKLTPEYLVADISGFFSSLTLLLVCIGIYGTLAYAVAGRTNEIGLRMALGARRTSVVFMILRDILWTLLAGIAAGVVGILAVGRLVASVLFQVTPRDPGTIGFAVLLVTLVALLAGYIPARRASRLDPVGALRLD
jgi:ABC-type antimicrobial peptide transport system permease subunit